DEGLPLGPVGLGVHVQAPGARPDARHAGERPQVGERVGVGLGFGVDVLGEAGHGRWGICCYEMGSWLRRCSGRWGLILRWVPEESPAAPSLNALLGVLLVATPSPEESCEQLPM